MSLAAAKLSKFVANTIEETGTEQLVPVQGQITGPTMAKVHR